LLQVAHGLGPARVGQAAIGTSGGARAVALIGWLPPRPSPTAGEVGVQTTAQGEAMDGGAEISGAWTAAAQ
jgi:hypothetical protein